MTSLRAIRYAIWAAIVLALAVIAGTFYWQQAGGAKLAGSLIGGPFTLTDQHGATVTEAAQHTGAAATQLRGASADLSTQAETMRSQVETFIAAIKTA